MLLKLTGNGFLDLLLWEGHFGDLDFVVDGSDPLGHEAPVVGVFEQNALSDDVVRRPLHVLGVVDSAIRNSSICKFFVILAVL